MFEKQNDNIEYKSIKEVADDWGVTVRRVQMLCNSGKLEGVKKYGRSWLIPSNVERPVDNRIVTGKFISTNKNQKKKENAENDFRLVLKVSHDIRTMLNSVLGYADLIQKNSKDSLRVTEYARNIEMSGKNTLRLTTNIFEIIRVADGRMGNEPTNFSIESVPKEVTRFNAEELRHKKLNVNQQVNVKHEIIFADKSRLCLAISNIFDNAAKYSAENQTINFTVEELNEVDTGVCLYRYTIEDFGVGIEENMLQMFENEDLDLINSESGIKGLGIPVTKSIVESMGGAVHFESKLHLGTRVTIVLPHQVSDLSTDIDIANKAELSAKVAGKRILVAEDNDLNRELACDLLKEAGFNVDSAEDGVICVAKLEQAEPDYYDFILMDVQMPNIDGILATKIIRGLKDKKKAGIPIIAATANVTKEERNKALTAGMNGFLEKPINVERLYALLDRILV